MATKKKAKFLTKKKVVEALEAIVQDEFYTSHCAVNGVLEYWGMPAFTWSKRDLQVYPDEGMRKPKMVPGEYLYAMSVKFETWRRAHNDTRGYKAVLKLVKAKMPDNYRERIV